MTPHSLPVFVRVILNTAYTPKRHKIHFDFNILLDLLSLKHLLKNVY